MSQYEYRAIQMPVQGAVSRLNEQIATMVAEGWEPIMLSGDSTVNVMMRRALTASEAAAAQAAATIAEPVGVASSS